MTNVKKPLVTIVALAFALLVAAGCSSSQPTGQVIQPGTEITGPQVQPTQQQAQPGTYQDLDVAQAQQLIASDKTLQIIDVREQYEYDGGHIPGAKLIPIGQFASRIGEIDKNRPVFVYCLSGSRSIPAVQVLAQSGYVKVYNLAPGIQSWTGQLER